MLDYEGKPLSTTSFDPGNGIRDYLEFFRFPLLVVLELVHVLLELLNLHLSCHLLFLRGLDSSLHLGYGPLEPFNLCTDLR